MTLVLVRVDCRLIHGQIIEAWVPFTRADCLVVANDDAAEDMLQRSIMEMAVPPTVEVHIQDVSAATDDLARGRWSDKRIILLFANCRDALCSYRAGLKYERLNLGNLVCSPGKKQVTCALSLDQSDVASLREIQKYGVQVEARQVPLDGSKNLNEIIGIGQYG
ncbi:MAG: PTS sugar transporter subunit IIB [Thermodesulfobacteriota bacterium]